MALERAVSEFGWRGVRLIPFGAPDMVRHDFGAALPSPCTWAGAGIRRVATASERERKSDVSKDSHLAVNVRALAVRSLYDLQAQVVHRLPRKSLGISFSAVRDGDIFVASDVLEREAIFQISN